MKTEIYVSTGLKDIVEQVAKNTGRISKMNPDGTVDDSFDTGDGFDAEVLQTVTDSAGKSIVFGNFTSYDGTPVQKVVRLNTDGSLDTSFDPDDIESYGNVRGITVDVNTDQVILYGNAFLNILDGLYYSFIKLNDDGTIDNQYKLQDDGDEYDVDVYQVMSLASGEYLYKYSLKDSGTDGAMTAFKSTDPTFTGYKQYVTSFGLDRELHMDTPFVIDSSGSTYVYEWQQNDFFEVLNYNILKYNSTGGTMTGITQFIPVDEVDKTYIDYNVKLYINQYDDLLVSVSLVNFGTVSKYVDGVYDNTFDSSDYNGFIDSIIQLDDDSYIVGGRFSTVSEVSSKYIAKLNNEGEVFTDFPVSYDGKIKEFYYGADGQIYIIGEFNTVATVIGFRQVEEYERLDMFDDENIIMNFKLKDSSDITKVFNTYSQTFTVPTSPKNDNLLNYYFDTSLVRETKRYLKCKIYVNSKLFKVGKIAIYQGKFKKGTNSAYTLNFFTGVATLKEAIGDDLLSALDFSDMQFPWTRTSVYDYLMNPDLSSDFLVPLISSDRIWSFGDGAAFDIKYYNSSGTKFINYSQLKPAVRFRAIMDKIIEKYNLEVECPLFTRDEYTKLFVWLNTKSTVKNNKIQIDIKNNSFAFNPGGFPPFFTTVTNTALDTIQFNDLAFLYTPSRIFEIRVEFLTLRDPITNVHLTDTPFKIELVDADTDEVVFVHQGPSSSDALLLKTFYLPQSPTPYSRRFKVFLSSDVDFTYSGFNIIFQWGVSAGNYWQSGSSNNSAGDSLASFDIQYNVGEMKVIDFVQSFFKMFNIKVREDKLSDKLYWETPVDFIGTERDYTPHGNFEEHTVKATTTYKQLDFKHADATYFRNVKYKELVNKDYGELLYNSDDTYLKDVYAVQTNFTIMNWTYMQDTNIKTSYGFDITAPEDNFYKPVTNSKGLTLMYMQGLSAIAGVSGSTDGIAYQRGFPQVTKVTQYVKFGNQDTDNEATYNASLTFDVDIEPDTDISYEKSLYLNYYAKEIEKTYNNNTRVYNFKCVLPVPEIDAFDLRNEIIIGEAKYSIEEAAINIINGETNLTLLNKAVAPMKIHYIDTTPPTNPTIFWGELSGPNSIGLIWQNANDNIEIKGYEIGWKLSGDTSYTTLPFIATSNEYGFLTFSGTSQGNVYDFRLRTQDTSDNWSIDYVYTQVAHTDEVLPIAPGYAYTYAAIRTMYLSWIGGYDNVRILGYDVQYKKQADMTYIDLPRYYTNSYAVDYFPVNFLNAETAYDFLISTVDSSGNVSSGATYTSGTTLAAVSFLRSDNSAPASATTNVEQCNLNVPSIEVFSYLRDANQQPVLNVNVMIYDDDLLETPFDGNGDWWRIGNKAYKVNSGGTITQISTACLPFSYSSFRSSQSISTVHGEPADPTDACAFSVPNNLKLYHLFPLVDMFEGQRFYSNNTLTTGFNGGNRWYKVLDVDTEGCYKIASNGEILDFVGCA